MIQWVLNISTDNEIMEEGKETQGDWVVMGMLCVLICMVGIWVYSVKNPLTENLRSVYFIVY